MAVAFLRFRFHATLPSVQPPSLRLRGVHLCIFIAALSKILDTIFSARFFISMFFSNFRISATLYTFHMYNRSCLWVANNNKTICGGKYIFFFENVGEVDDNALCIYMTLASLACKENGCSVGNSDWQIYGKLFPLGIWIFTEFEIIIADKRFGLISWSVECEYAFCEQPNWREIIVLSKDMCKQPNWAVEWRDTTCQKPY